jgi:hypothetical protein
MHTYAGTLIVTGGSSVKNGYWNAIDFPEENERGFWTKRLRDLSRITADYLLATGQAGKGFGYFRFKNFLVIQSRTNPASPPQKHIFMSSLIKLLVDFPDEDFIIKTPFDRETSIEIRRLVMQVINYCQPKIAGSDDNGKPLSVKASADINRLQFVQ